MDRSLESPWAWQHIKSLMSKLLDDFAHYHPHPNGSSITHWKKVLRKKILRKSSTENKIEKETKTSHLTVSYHTPSVAKFFHPFFCDKGAFFSDALFWGLLADLLVEDFKIIWELVHKEFCRLTATKPDRGKTMHTLFYQSEQRLKPDSTTVPEMQKNMQRPLQHTFRKE